MYAATPDPYCYPGTGVLKNRAGLTAQDALEQFETAMTFARSEEPLPSGRLSVSHYRAVHRHLFQDVYSWAGRYRTVRITKDASTFCYPEYIPAEMTRIFAELKEGQYMSGLSRKSYSQAAAHFISELNAVHPFREGNGRTQLTFLALLSDRAGHPLRFDTIDPQETIDAMIQGFQGREVRLQRLILKLTG